jgi:hypothetical protein
VPVVPAGTPVAAIHAFADGRPAVTLAAEVQLEAGQTMEVTAA